MFYLDHDERKVLMKRTLSILLILLLVLSPVKTGGEIIFDSFPQILYDREDNFLYLRGRKR